MTKAVDNFHKWFTRYCRYAGIDPNGQYAEELIVHVRVAYFQSRVDMKKEQSLMARP